MAMDGSPAVIRPFLLSLFLRDTTNVLPGYIVRGIVSRRAPPIPFGFLRPGVVAELLATHAAPAALFCHLSVREFSHFRRRAWLLVMGVNAER
jgi:hypothetical protein